MKPYIICAAIITIQENREYPCVENGNLRIGMSHASIVNMNQISSRKVPISDGAKGFLTSELHFVYREEAAKIAYEAGQTSIKLSSLYSDDINLNSAYSKFIHDNPDKKDTLENLKL